MTTYRPPLIRSLRLQNFRSVHDEEIHFDNPLFLVGRNGTGKSNVVDALRLLSEAMREPLSAVIRRRGGIFYQKSDTWGIGRNQTPLSIEIEMEANTISEWKARYRIEFILLKNNVIKVTKEDVMIMLGDGNVHSMNREGFVVTTNVPGISPSITEDLSLILPIISGTIQFEPVYRALSSIRVYNFDVQSLRGIQPANSETMLSSDGSNLSHIIDNLDSDINDALNDYVASLLDMDVEVTSLPVNSGGDQEINFDGQRVVTMSQRDKDGRSNTFSSFQMSDGTLKAIGVLLSGLQNHLPSCIVIEEPESGLHPGALNVIADAIEATSEHTQVIVTTHSPDLLDAKWIKPENLRVVTNDEDGTHVFRLGRMAQGALKDHLMYAGQLMRANALDIDTGSRDETPESVPIEAR